MTKKFDPMEGFLEPDRERDRKFRKAPTEEERVDRLLKHCGLRLVPTYEAALKKIQMEPDWRKRFKGVIDLSGVEKLLAEEMAANSDQEPLANTTTADVHLRQDSIPLVPEATLEELNALFAASSSRLAEDGEEALTQIPEEEKVPNSKVPKKLVSVRIPVDLLERVRDAVYHSPGVTMSDFAEDAFLKALEQLEENRGEAFPQRAGNIRKGRPIR